MNVIRSLEAFTACRQSLTGKIGFVPTMGALHEGHLSLVRLAQKQSDHVIVSIYVNPTQFSANEDFDSYPVQIDQDVKLLEREDVSVCFLPTTDEIYPAGYHSPVQPGKCAAGLESDFRPHFFKGVVDVVYRLFDIVKPDLACFGEKDFQQLCVIEEMVKTYKMGIDITGGPTVRDQDGLALSSRNAYLGTQEKKIACALNLHLKEVAKDPGEKAIAYAKTQLLDSGFDKIEYLAYRKDWNRVLAAAWIGRTRLIDNFPVTDT